MSYRTKYRPNFRQLIEPDMLIFIAIAIVVATLLLVAFTKNIPNFRKKYRKKYRTYLYSLLAISLILPILGTTQIVSDRFEEFIFYQVIILIMGGFHVRFFRTYFNKFELESKGPWQEILFSLVIMIYLTIPFAISFSYLNSTSFTFIMLTAFLTFIIPTFYYATFIASVSIPTKFYKTWEFPIKGAFPEPTDEDYRDMVVLTFAATKSPHTGEMTEFRAKSPLRMDFDKLFYHFVYDYNDRNPESPININDEYGHRQHWVFYLKPNWYSATKYIDPKLPLYMNGIEENSVIYCVRTVPKKQPKDEGWIEPSKNGSTKQVDQQPLETKI